jgi:hypothetical protein
MGIVLGHVVAGQRKLSGKGLSAVAPGAHIAKSNVVGE